MGGKRAARPAAERAAEIDRKIESHKARIAQLEEKRNAILNPAPRKTKAAKLKAVLEQAKKSGMSPEEIAERLGLPLE